jgi:flagellar biosynthesis protein FliQ
MTPESVITLGHRALEVTVLLTAPMLGSALAIGLLIGLIQAATQINEQTLSFVPKLLVLVMVLFMVGPWMLQLIMDFAITTIRSIPGAIG